MQHLKGFGLENFRVFKESTWFDFAPITILVGPNSSGKSSVTKALALLKNSMESEEGGLNFNKNETVLQLGNFSRILNKNSESDSIVFTFSFELNNFPTFGQSKLIKIEREYKKTENSLDGELIRISLKFDGEIFVNRSKNGLYTINTSIIRDNLFFDKDKVSIERESVFNGDGELVEGLNYIIANNTIFDDSLENELMGGYIKKTLYKNKKESIVQEIMELYSSNKKGEIISLSNEEIIKNEWYGVSLVLLLLNKAGFSNTEANYINEFFLGNFLGNPSFELEYKYNLKAPVKRIYRREEDDLFNQLLTIHSSNSEFVKKWCEEFKLLDELKIINDEKNNIQSLEVGLPLVEQGFGISQIITHLLRISIFKNKILMFEEPEANLHPAFQSKLADMFLEALEMSERYAKYRLFPPPPRHHLKKQFIIETHSEYMIRKFQYLVAKGEMKKDDIVIYYFNDPNNIPVGEKQVKKIEILEDGSLSDDFGSGFFDEAANWKFELMQLRKAPKN